MNDCDVLVNSVDYNCITVSIACFYHDKLTAADAVQAGVGNCSDIIVDDGSVTLADGYVIKTVTTSNNSNVFICCCACTSNCYCIACFYHDKLTTADAVQAGVGNCSDIIGDDGS